MASEESRPFLSKYSGAKEGDEIDLSVSMRIAAKKGRVIRWKTVIIIGAVVVGLMLLVVLGVVIGVFASRGSKSASPKSIAEQICANPPLLLISLDGFRASYLERDLNPNLKSFIKAGVEVPFMKSSFPTMTFPNHYSIATGLYPESHGIINNNFYDTELKEQFSIRSSNASDSKWWKGEPIWVTASKHKLTTGIYFWPGSEAKIQGIRPDYYFKYDGSVPFNERVDTVLSWLDFEEDKRPQFLGLYFNQPDHNGHVYGPDSAQVNTSLGDVDKVIGRLWAGLEQRNISSCVNIIIISDHGMTTINMSTVVHTNELLPPHLNSSKDITYPSYGPVMNIGVTKGEDAVREELYETLVANGSSMGLPFRAFHLENIPYRLHAGHYNKQRYGPVYLLADLHSFLLRKPANFSIGQHGFDNIEEDMQAIVIARGPAFGKSVTTQPFENVQLYSLMCDLLNITAAPSNGTHGSLHSILDPKVAKDLPPPTAPGGTPGVTTSCPLPRDNATFVARSTCEACICSDYCVGVNHTSILESNRLNFNLTNSQKAAYQEKHFPWGVPPGGRGDGACVLEQPEFVHVYSNSLHIPLLVGYTITQGQSNNSSNSSDDDDDICYRRDPRVEPANSANCSLYNSTGSFVYLDPMDFDLWTSEEVDGLPSSLLPVSLVVQGNSLSASVLSATLPLQQNFIQEVGFPLRLALSDWLQAYQTLSVMFGSVLDVDRDGLRDPDSTYPRVEGVAVPSHVFVVVTRCNNSSVVELGDCSVGDLELLGMLFQHPLEPGDYQDSVRVLRYALTSLRDIERVTGLNFFPHLTAQQQNQLELRLMDQLWPTPSLNQTVWE